jgi:dihydrofolate reductase
MRKIILGVAISMDGYIEGPEGEYDWCPPPSQEEMNKFLEDIDIIFFGRKSYELFGSGAYPGKTSYVFSNTLKSVEGKDTHLLSGDVVSAVKKIKGEQGKNIWLWGGANLATTFINEGLVDELWLAVVPVVLGAGKPLFQEIRHRTHFKVAAVTLQKGYLSTRFQYDPAKR